MKVSGIGLLQMIKDGKVPYNDHIEVSGGTHSHHPYVVLYKNNRLYWEWKKGSSVVLTDELLEYDFEISKPTEEIEELKYDHNFYSLTRYNELNFEFDKIAYILNGINESIELSLKNTHKTNELIKELNNLKKQKNKKE